MRAFVLVLLAIIVGCLVYGVVIFNTLIRQRNQAKNGFAQIDVQLQRRHDLIPNLVKTASRYLTHEERTLTAVINARNQAKALQNEHNHEPESTAHMQLFAEAEAMLSKALGQFSAVVEAYPELKADTMMQKLMAELTHTENCIGFARQHYNDSVMFYNNAREVFPNVIISTMFGFRALNPLLFEDKSALQRVPVVDFDTQAV